MKIPATLSNLWSVTTTIFWLLLILPIVACASLILGRAVLDDIDND